MTVYLNHQFLPKAEARISPDDRGFLFGDGVYEVVRFYRGRLFEAAAHWERFDRSLQELRMVQCASDKWRGSTRIKSVEKLHAEIGMSLSN
jgi:branched-subunit amino acid aminotransferase/4-amino-4-deoxychorismate lyase